MLRRYEARRQIKQAQPAIRLALWVIFTPIVMCVLIKLWSLSIVWVLQ